MEHDTAGNPIRLPLYNCECGLTGGCEICNPILSVNALDRYLQETAKNAVPLEEIRKITDKLPSLTKILMEDK